MVYAAVLLMGACGSASRTVVVEPSIGQIVLRVAAGGVVGNRGSGQHDRGWRLDDVGRVGIDGTDRRGAIAWLHAGAKIAGFVTDAWPSGSVEWDYAVRVKGLRVWRHTEIRDGFVRLTTDIRGPLGPRGEMYRVVFTITATEGAGGTKITGVATGWTHIGQRCRLVARIAGREVSKGLQRDLLGAVERGGRRLYAEGDVSALVDEFVARMRR